MFPFTQKNIVIVSLKSIAVLILCAFACLQSPAQDLRDLFVGEYIGTLIETKKGTGKVDTISKTYKIYLFKSFTSDSLFCKRNSINAMFTQNYYVHKDTTFTTNENITKPYPEDSFYGELISNDELHHHWYASGGAGVGLVTYDFFGGRTDWVGVGEQSVLTVECYPNPTIGKVILLSGTKIESIKIRDLSGRTLQNSEVHSLQGTADLSNYPSGLYFIEIQTQGGSGIKKVMKE